MSTAAVPASVLRAEDVTLAYDQRVVVEGLDVDVLAGEFTVVVGPNACGKSTLLRALSRLLKPKDGLVLLDGQDIQRSKTKDVARRLGLLPQTSIAPDGITVADLVSRGRHPEQKLFRQQTLEDRRAVAKAMAVAEVTELAPRLVDELSGGQRQRVWVAMVLAQQTPVMLLDEPTTFLDIAHQVSLMELFAALNAQGRTLVAVLHDLNHAARFATRIVAMADGRIVAQGRPEEVVTEANVEEIFGLPSRVIPDPVTGTPLVVPLRTGHAARMH